MPVGKGNIVNTKQDLGRHVSIVDEGLFSLYVYQDGADNSHMVCEGGRPCERWLVLIYDVCERQANV